MLDITVVIPTIPPRAKLFARAACSVAQQTLAAPIQVAVDEHKEGAARTRQRALEHVRTPWVAFLDDDDEFLPHHLDSLARAALKHDADYIFSWYTVVGGNDPRPEVFGKPFDPAHPVQTTITTLVRTDLARATGFLPDPGASEDLASPDRHYAGEDWRFTLRCINAGARIHHHPEKTWLWHHHGHNTSGLPKNW